MKNWLDKQDSITNAIQKIKETPDIDPAIQTALNDVPVIGSFLYQWYTNAKKEKNTDIIDELVLLLEEFQIHGKSYFSNISKDILSRKSNALTSFSLLNFLPYNSLIEIKTKLELNTYFSKNENSINQKKILKKINKILNEKQNPKQQFSIDNISLEKLDSQGKIQNYLKTISEQFDFEKDFNGKTIQSYFIFPNMVKAELSTFLEPDENIVRTTSKFNINEFLKSKQRFLLVAGSFGVGKTTFLKYLTSKFAKKCLENLDDQVYFPIFISLKYGLSSLKRQFHNDSLISSTQKIILILDGLDEYGESKNDLMKYINELTHVSPNLKVIISSTLNPGIIETIPLKDYVRILPFTIEQTKKFFRNYGSKISYDRIWDYGFLIKDTNKPLFCIMLINAFGQNISGLDYSNRISSKTQKYLIYSQIIQNLIKNFTKQYNEKHYNFLLNTKTLLQKLAAIRQIHGKLSDNIIQNESKNFELSKSEKEIFTILRNRDILVIEKFDQGQNTIEFAFPSFYDYALAEYYLKCIIENQMTSLNLGVCSNDTLDFLYGLLDIFSYQSDFLKPYSEIFLQTIADHYERIYEINDIKKHIVHNSKKIFETDELILSNVGNNISYDKRLNVIRLKNVDYRTFWLHRWITMLVLSRLHAHKEINLKFLESLIRETSHNMPNYFKIFKNMDMSGCDLSNTDLSNSDFSGCDLSYANLSHSNLSFSNLSNTKIVNADLTNANVTNTMMFYANVTHSNLFRANLSKTNLSGTDLSHTNLQQADLSKANLENCSLSYTVISGVNLEESIFLPLKSEHMIFDSKIHLKNIRIFESQNKKSSKKLISKFESKFIELILRDNPKLGEYLN